MVAEIQAGCAGLGCLIAVDKSLFQSQFPVGRAVCDGEAFISEGGVKRVDLGGLIALGAEVSDVVVAFEIAGESADASAEFPLATLERTLKSGVESKTEDFRSE